MVQLGQNVERDLKPFGVDATLAVGWAVGLHTGL